MEEQLKFEFIITKGKEILENFTATIGEAFQKMHDTKKEIGEDVELYYKFNYRFDKLSDTKIYIKDSNGKESKGYSTGYQ